MLQHQQIITEPIFILFVAFSCALSLGYFWGRRRNHSIFRSAFNDLMQVIQPDDQTFTNIGGAIGYHGNFFIKRGGSISRVDATITLLPRHSWLYLPLSKLIRKYDRLFITVHFERPPVEEAHLIEAKHAGFGQRKIGNSAKLQKEQVRWGRYEFYLYYVSPKMREQFVRFMQQNLEPGIIRHIALVPQQRQGFIFVIPRKGQVAEAVAKIYRWLPSLLST